jgi:hypothetical protein
MVMSSTSAVAVKNGGTLGGNGTVSGNTTMDAGSTLSPGTNASAARQAEADAERASDRPLDGGGAASLAPEEPGRASSPRLIFAVARRTCTWAGEQAARARDYDGARYDDEPRLYQRDGWVLRGRMRLQDRRGYRLVDTVCKVDDAGEVERFALLR